MTSETMSVSELIATALGDEEDDATWDAIGELQKRATPEILDAANALCSNADPAQRARGATILSQLGYGQKLTSECVVILLPMLADTDANVRLKAACALSWKKDARCLPELVAHSSDPDWNIRHAIVNALSGFEDRAATDALIKMTGDSDKLIRDWAAFGLGSQCEADYPELRDALHVCLADDDAIVRGEAIKGLAARADPRTLAALEQELRNGVEHANGDSCELGYFLDASKYMKNPLLVPALAALIQNSDPALDNWRTDIQETIDACAANS